MVPGNRLFAATCYGAQLFYATSEILPDPVYPHEVQGGWILLRIVELDYTVAFNTLNLNQICGWVLLVAGNTSDLG